MAYKQKCIFCHVPMQELKCQVIKCKHVQPGGDPTQCRVTERGKLDDDYGVHYPCRMRAEAKLEEEEELRKEGFWKMWGDGAPKKKKAAVKTEDLKNNAAAEKIAVGKEGAVPKEEDTMPVKEVIEVAIGAPKGVARLEDAMEEDAMDEDPK